MAKVFVCVTCGVEFQRGRGRPPAVILCPAHEAARPSGTKMVIRKVSANITENPSVKEPFRGRKAPPSAEDIKEHLLPEDDVAPVRGAVGNGPITEPCPNCKYAYADGGYCKECGWTKKIVLHPYGSVTGKVRS